MTRLVRDLTAGQKVLDSALAVLAFGLCALAAAGSGSGLLVGGGSALVFATAVGVRRWCPWAMVGLAVLAGTVLLVDASVNAGSVLVVVLLFATTGSDQDRRIRRVGLVAVIAASAGAGVAAGTHGFFGENPDASPRSGLVVALEIAVVAGSAWLIGFVRYQRRLAAEARIGEKIARVELAHEQERTRIARDMHDVVAHTLAVVVAQAEGARYAMKQQPGAAEGTLRTIADTCRGSLHDVRRLLSELRGEPAAASETLGEDALLQRMRLAGLDLEVSDVGEQRPLAEPQAAVERWVLTEALTNALKHGTAGRSVTMRRSWGDQLELTVSNTVPLNASMGRGGHGLTGIAERVRLAGGWSDHRIEDDHFVLRVRLPYDTKGDA